MESIDLSLIPIEWLILLIIMLGLMVCIIVLMFFFIFPSLTPKWMLPKDIDKPTKEYVSEYHSNYGGGYLSSETKKEDTSSWDNNNINLMQGG